MLNDETETFVVIKDESFILKIFFCATRMFVIYFTILQQHHLYLDTFLNKININMYEHHFHIHIHL
jgi:hypothetical protein